MNIYVEMKREESETFVSQQLTNIAVLSKQFLTQFPERTFLGPTLRYFNPFHNLTASFFRIHFLLPYHLLSEFTYEYFSHYNVPMHTTYQAHLTLFDIYDTKVVFIIRDQKRRNQNKERILFLAHTTYWHMREHQKLYFKTYFSDFLTLALAFLTYELKLPRLIPYNFSLTFYVSLPSYHFRFPLLISSCRDPFLSDYCDVTITTSYICSAHSA